MTKPSILIATTNRGKHLEVRAVCEGLPAKWLSLDDQPACPEPVEDGETFEANAVLKALYYARHSGLLTLADDSGLVVDALGGEPGIYSARYAGDDADDRANNAKLIEALKDVPPEERTARFRCVVALANPRGVLATASGTVEGLIVDEPVGENGFGYDPHFFVPEFGMTTAQMEPEHKNRISHRGQALRAIRSDLERVLADASASSGGGGEGP